MIGKLIISAPDHTAKIAVSLQFSIILPLLPDDLPSYTNIFPDSLHNKLPDFHHSKYVLWKNT
jgi:hypothetical protein